MLEIKPKRIKSYNSEDENFPVRNLLKTDVTSYWKCKTISERQIYVEFELEKSMIICSVEIANYGSAFIEVQVSRKTCDVDDYQVLLVSRSLMTPIESVKCQGINHIRTFTLDHFTKSVGAQKWDIIKFVCSQPFNKTIQYGLTYVKLFTKPLETQANEQSVSNIVIDNINSNHSQSLLQSTELLFDQTNNKEEPIQFTNFLPHPKVNTSLAETQKIDDTQILPNSTPIISQLSRKAVGETSDTQIIPNLSKKSTDLMFDTKLKSEFCETIKLQNDDTPIIPRTAQNSTQELADTQIVSTDSTNINQNKKETQKSPTEFTKIPSLKLKTDKTMPYVSQVSDASGDTVILDSRAGSTNYSSSTPSITISKEPSYRFDEIFNNVFFVLSGYKNPMRDNIRRKALEMGAEYKSNWDQSCTHLICAFSNTPKFKEVLGKGIIVNEKWVLDSYEMKMCLPWRKYRLSGARSPSPRPSSSSNGLSWTNKRKLQENETEIGMKKTKSNPNEIDTDDEIENCLNDNKLKVSNSSMKTNITSNSSSSLPSIFNGKNFFLYGTFTTDERKYIKRMIIVFDGILLQYMGPTVDIVLTHSVWDDNFDQAKKDFPKLEFLRPDWIKQCDEKRKCLPVDDFLINKC